MPHYLFDRNLKITKVISDDDVIESLQDFDLNVMITHTIEIPWSMEADEALYFGMPDPLKMPGTADDPLPADNFWMYRIARTEKGGTGRSIVMEGVHKFFDDLKGKNYIKEIRPQNAEFRSVIGRILDGTGWTPRVGASVNTLASTSDYYVSPLTALRDAVAKWNVDFLPHMRFQNGRITEQTVYFERRIGEDLGKTYVYGDKLIQAIASSSSEDLYTAYVGRGRGERTGETNIEGDEVYTRKITFADVTWDKKKGLRTYPIKVFYEKEQVGEDYENPSFSFTVDKQGEKDLNRIKKLNNVVSHTVERHFDESKDNSSEKPSYEIHWITQSDPPPVDKPKGQEWVENKAATALYGYPDGSPRIGHFDDEYCTDPEQLLEDTWEHVYTQAHPKLQLKTNVFDTERLLIGEIVRIKRDDLAMLYKTRVYRVKRNFKNTKIQEIEFGDVIIPTGARSTVTENVAKADASRRQEEETRNYIINRQGNRINYGAQQPPKATVGDLWFLDELNGTQHILYWTGTKWRELVSSKTQKQIADQVNAVKEESDTAIKRATETAKDDLDQAVKLLEEEHKNFILKQDADELIGAALSPDKVYASMLKWDASQITAIMQKGDVIGVLNHEAGQTLITQGNKSYIRVTPDTTYIADATIKNSMIESLSASKLTAGTIDASRISVINLDANNITSGTIDASRVNVYNLNADNIRAGTISGYQSSWNLNTGWWSSWDGSDSKLELYAGKLWVTQGGSRIGSIGANTIEGYPNTRGIVFDLAPSGAYMAWASKSSSSESYMLKMIYTRDSVNKYSSDTVTFDCNVQFNGEVVSATDAIVTEDDVERMIRSAFTLPITSGILLINEDTEGDLVIKHRYKSGGIVLGNYANAIGPDGYHRI